jgi:hypothetical protein
MIGYQDEEKHMLQTTPNTDLLNQYANGVRRLLAPPAPATGERGAGGPVSPAEVITQAEALALISANLTNGVAEQLQATSIPLRQEATIQLLAKALTDLHVSNYLLEAALDEPYWEILPKERSGERSAQSLTAVEEPLNMLLSGGAAPAVVVERGGATAKATLPPRSEAITTLTFAINDTLELIRARAARSAQSAVAGVIGMGLGQLGEAAGIVSLGVAQALGQAEQVTRLMSLFRQFVENVFSSITSLLGEALAQTAAKQAVEWLSGLTGAEQTVALLERLYQTSSTRDELTQEVMHSRVGIKKMVTAKDELMGLGDKFQQQAGLVDKLLKGLKFLGVVPGAALPQGMLLMAAAYLLLLSYIVLAGADFVDAPAVSRLNRVVGVRKVIEVNL